VGKHAMRNGLRNLIAVLCVAGLSGLRLGRFAIALYGLGYEFGVPWAVIAAVALLALRLDLVIRVGAFLTMVALWRWPWIGALALAAPRLFLVLPGLVAAVLAHLRHPQPRWPREMASASAAAGSRDR
jgi:hypothetical protein